MEYQLITVNEESLKIGLKIHKGKTKFMTSIDTTDNIQINGREIEKVTNYKRLGPTISMENSTKQEISIRIKAGWSVFGKYREIFLDIHLPMSLKRKVYNQCVLPAMTYRCKTWFLTKAYWTDIVQYVTNAKWKWAGHIARMKENRWTIRSTEWQTEGVRSA